jgi:hypothetical protein
LQDNLAEGRARYTFRRKGCRLRNGTIECICSRSEWSRSCTKPDWNLTRNSKSSDPKGMLASDDEREKSTNCETFFGHRM